MSLGCGRSRVLSTQTQGKHGNSTQRVPACPAPPSFKETVLTTAPQCQFNAPYRRKEISLINNLCIYFIRLSTVLFLSSKWGVSRLCHYKPLYHLNCGVDFTSFPAPADWFCCENGNSVGSPDCGVVSAAVSSHRGVGGCESERNSGVGIGGARGGRGSPLHRSFSQKDPFF